MKIEDLEARQEMLLEDMELLAASRDQIDEDIEKLHVEYVKNSKQISDYWATSQG